MYSGLLGGERQRREGLRTLSQNFKRIPYAEMNHKQNRRVTYNKITAPVTIERRLIDMQLEEARDAR